MTAPGVDLNDVFANVTVEFGRKEIAVADARKIRVGDTIQLDKLAGEAFDLLVNGTGFAECEVVVVTDLMAARLTRMIDPKGAP